MFTICLNTSTIKPASLPVKIDAAAKAGFEAIELWNVDIDAYLEQGGSMDELINLLHAANLVVPNVVAVTRWLGCAADQRNAQRGEAIRRMKQAQQLKAPHISCTPPRNRVSMQQAGMDYAELMRIGRDYGVLPTIEFIAPNEFVNGIPSAWEIVQRANDPEGSIVVDLFHVVCGQTTTKMDLEAIPSDRIAIVHMNDVKYQKPFNELQDGERVMPGEGDIPLDEYFDVLRKMGYHGAVSLEVFNEGLWTQDPYRVAAIGYEKCRPWLVGESSEGTVA